MTDNKLSQIGPPRFAIAVHALIWLAKSSKLQTSSILAEQVNSHATFLRRVLAQLADSGIVETKEGRDGGYSLKIPAQKLTLADIYITVKPECIRYGEEEVECGKAGKQLDQLLEEILNKAEHETIKYLKAITLEQVMDTIDFTDFEKSCTG
ncbi:RrF2 family transcriptional regulator [Peribacillus sp. JNUCC 23]